MKKKICLVSSCGGHFMELMQLLPAVKDNDFYIVTEKNVASMAIVEKYKHYYLVQQLQHLVLNMLQIMLGVNKI